jgi:hypothetical protein
MKRLKTIERVKDVTSASRVWRKRRWNGNDQKARRTSRTQKYTQGREKGHEGPDVPGGERMTPDGKFSQAADCRRYSAVPASLAAAKR